jgi:16S rRNA pseudouridine516 synthase
MSHSSLITPPNSIPISSPLRRLDQILSSLGYGTRREAAAWVSEGRIHINGVPATRPDQKADPTTVTVDGKPLDHPNGLLAMLHKPLDYSCTHSEAEGANIYELLPETWLDRKPTVTSIGRLDKDTTGLILITDQGSLVHRYTSPKSDLGKTYEVTVDKDLDPTVIETFARGDLILRSETKPCLPAHLEITGPRSAALTLTEGRYHQVRRMFASQGYHVETLHRTRFGPYTLDDLPEGEWKYLDL